MAAVSRLASAITQPTSSVSIAYSCLKHFVTSESKCRERPARRLMRHVQFECWVADEENGGGALALTYVLKIWKNGGQEVATK